MEFCVCISCSEEVYWHFVWYIFIAQKKEKIMVQFVNCLINTRFFFFQYNFRVHLLSRNSHGVTVTRSHATQKESRQNPINFFSTSSHSRPIIISCSLYQQDVYIDQDEASLRANPSHSILSPQHPDHPIVYNKYTFKLESPIETRMCRSFEKEENKQK